ncbi:MAG: FadR/GntR family transcriptional regulator [Eubacteriales bacterium]
MSEGMVKRYSLSKQISEKLESMIGEGEFAVGEKIPSENELVTYFGVSRNTLREAIHSLILAGVLEAKQGAGTFVRSKNRFRANMDQQLSQCSTADIIEARTALELSVVKLACDRRTTEDLDFIMAELQKRGQLINTEKEHTTTDLAFHIAIAKSSHNQVLVELYHALAVHMDRTISERNRETTMTHQEIDAVHAQLFVAICERDVEKAQSCVHKIMEI